MNQPRRRPSEQQAGQMFYLTPAPDSLSALGLAALAYAARGWPVFPCKPRGKEPLTVHGFKDASTDADTIREWWSRWPNANIGIPTGARTFVALDVDARNGGDETLYALEHEQGELPPTPHVLTGGGGSHYYFQATQLLKSRPLAEGIDLRAEGGYVIAPPSIHPSGSSYNWEAQGHPDDVPLAPLPDWLLALAAEHSTSAQPSGAAIIPQGRRNATLTSLAGSMRRRGATPEAIAAALLAENAARCQPPLPEAEVRRIAVSISRYSPAPAPTPTRPQIDAGIRDLETLSEQAWAAVTALNQPPFMFQHGGRPVRLERDLKGNLVLRELTLERLRHEADRAAYWYRRERSGETWKMLDAAPPKDIIADMLAYPAERLPLPYLERISLSPTFAPDGTLLDRDGFHAPSGTLVRLEGLTLPPVPRAPAAQDLQQALGLLCDDLLGDFPFVAEADRTHAIALLLLPFVRDLIQGPTPLHLIEAPTPGSGKGLLASALLLPATGGDIGLMTQGRDEDEWRKRITTRVREGKAAILLDNINRELDSGTLSSALTAYPIWGDRALGSLEALNIPVRCAWVATGNNPELSTEIARRCIRIRLDAKTDRPWQRNEGTFRHPALLIWAQQQRSALVHAALVLVQSWLAAGRPAPQGRLLGSYEAWTAVIGGILQNAGLRGFLENLDELYERADTEGAVWRRFVQAWWDKHGDAEVGVADLYPIALEFEDFDLGKGQERAQKIALGMALGRRRDVVLGEYRIELARAEKQGAKRYRLIRMVRN